MKKKKFKWWKIPIIIILVIIAAALIYLGYMIATYSRIPDNTPVDVVGTAKNSEFKVGEEYTAMTYNIGFGAYTPDFTFFMDGGTQSWANSESSVIACINGDIDLINEQKADIAVLQEVDIDATRSYHVDEAAMLKSAFPETSSTMTINYHSKFLMYPFYQPHGASVSGLLTISDAQINSCLRRSLPINQSMARFVDLDRAYAINRLSVDNGKELVIFNVHLSAYGTNGGIQQAQMTMLFDDMKAAYDEGAYVICAGDFNHDFVGNSGQLFNEENGVDDVNWAAPFPDDLIPEHFAKVDTYTGGMNSPSCRNCDVPYGDDCFTLIVDGFIVSDNVEPTYMNVADTQFEYSDHNPVVMKFKLKT